MKPPIAAPLSAARAQLALREHNGLEIATTEPTQRRTR